MKLSRVMEAALIEWLPMDDKPLALPMCKNVTLAALETRGLAEAIRTPHGTKWRLTVEGRNVAQDLTPAAAGVAPVEPETVAPNEEELLAAIEAHQEHIRTNGQGSGLTLGTRDADDALEALEALWYAGRIVPGCRTSGPGGKLGWYSVRMIEADHAEALDTNALRDAYMRRQAPVAVLPDRIVRAWDAMSNDHMVFDFGMTKRLDESVPAAPVSRDDLVAIGGRPWTPQGGGVERIYINNWQDLLKIEIDRYGTGNISSATVGGVRISNGAAGKLPTVKIYWSAGEWYGIDAVAGIVRAAWSRADVESMWDAAIRAATVPPVTARETPEIIPPTDAEVAELRVRIMEALHLEALEINAARDAEVHAAPVALALVKAPVEAWVLAEADVVGLDDSPERVAVYREAGSLVRRQRTPRKLKKASKRRHGWR